ncbi:dTDP-4-dehydrorhamnose 3,5-epimerase [Fusobacterium sp. PH5-44]|uniref:dTDP-4-dehydrorhamnose 3,5-epimerase n=1 Tax=unclassified Fusobacterium TaxID=2648384 RepID=UPI003D1BFB0E
MKYNVYKKNIKGLLVIEPVLYQDDRGFFIESYKKKDFEKIGINEYFVQDNYSSSKKGVFRGLHFQTKKTQSKLIKVTRGMGVSFAVDLRHKSSTFGCYEKVLLSDKNKLMFYIPKGFAHGFLSLEDNTELYYKCSDYYDSDAESGIYWLDSDLKIEYELEKHGLKSEEIILSEKDKTQQTLKEFMEKRIRLEDDGINF